MKFSVTRENLLEPLQRVAGVVERRQTLPILSNVLVAVKDDILSLTGTDQEVELSAYIREFAGDGEDVVTIPARKFLDICRSLPETAGIEVAREDARVRVTSGRFSSHLATLPADEFPLVEMGPETASLGLAGRDFCRLLDKCSFAMAQQDVRYFFNGMLLEIEPAGIRAVATNGQRLATSFVEGEMAVSGKLQVIIPRKGVAELSRLVPADDKTVTLQFSSNHLRASTGVARLTSRLIDATYPDYSRAIPVAGDKILVGDRLEIKDALTRAAILSNEMYRNVRLQLGDGRLGIHANNPLQEEAEETVSVDYDGADLEIGFNVGYLIDALGAMEGDKVRMQFSDGSSAALFMDASDSQSRFVVSPMMI